MNYNIELTLAGLILNFSVFISYISSKKMETPQYKIFPFYIIVNFLLLLFDLISTITVAERDLWPKANAFFSRGYVIFIILYITITTIFTLYCGVHKHSTRSRKRISGILSLIMTIISIFIVIYCIFGEIKYSGSGRRIYSYGKIINTAYIYATINLILMIIILIVNKSEMTLKSLIPVWIYIFIELIAASIQFFNPEFLIVGFFSALCQFIVFRSLELSKSEIEQNNIIRSFAEVIEGRDENTGEHVKRTTDYVRIIINVLKKNKKYKKILTKEYSDAIWNAAALHDVGKLSIPDSVLLKPGPLNPEERKIIETHAQIGFKIIKSSFKKIGTQKFNHVAEMLALSHHEKWDGTGYPEGLSKTEIPLSARIMAVADVFDAVSQRRVYRPPMPLEKAFSIIEEGRGTHFDPEIVDAFLSAKDEIKSQYNKYYNS